MSLAVLCSRAVCGLEGFAVRVEVHVASGLPSFTMVGLASTDVRESRDRVRSAIVSSGFEFPAGRITVNLAPADIPKESGRFDLPIALGVLLASGQISFAADASERDLAKYVFAGELSLTGAVMPVRAPLAIALAVARSDPHAVLVFPASSALIAAQVPGLSVLALNRLAELVDHFSGRQPLPYAQAEPRPPAAPVSARLAGEGNLARLCLGDVRGQALARRALEVAAAGGHSLLMSGPPGAGKSMIAQRLPGILPRLPVEHALEAAALAGLGGGEGHYSDLPPFRAPHHTASGAALVGGGAIPRPGEISLAHRGVLFLDELPEFQRHVLESLREPLETGVITIARSARTLTYPAAFQLVAAMNPCPCGWLGHPRRSCECRPDAITKYRARISGPLLDRIDIQISLPPVDVEGFDAPKGEPSSAVRERVERCRKRQLARQPCINALLGAGMLEQICAMDAPARQLLKRSLARWSWSARVMHRILRVARTVADLDECDSVSAAHLAQAIRMRQPWE
jgi:magnesium chelatase family protein